MPKFYAGAFHAGSFGACPPEDCGGIWGYYGMVEALNDRTANRPEHEEYEDMWEWLGIEENEDWYVNYFDMEETNARMQAYL